MIILTVVFRGDLANLLYQAVSLKKFWQGDKRWMIVIEDCQETLDYCQNRIKPLMDDWNVYIINKYMSDSTSGWHRQQSLKLLAASDQTVSNMILVLDAKNFLVRNSSLVDFFYNDVYRVQVHSDTNSEDWKRCCDFFQIYNKTRGYNTTPWLWRKDLVIKTIEELCIRGIDLYKGDISPVIEFECYWIVNQDSITWKKADLCDGVYSTDVDANTVLERINWMKKLDKPFWSFHRYHWNNKLLTDISNGYLKDKQVIDDSLILEWYYTNKFQSQVWANKMKVC